MFTANFLLVGMPCSKYKGPLVCITAIRAQALAKGVCLGGVNGVFCSI